MEDDMRSGEVKIKYTIGGGNLEGRSSCSNTETDFTINLSFQKSGSAEEASRNRDRLDMFGLQTRFIHGVSDDRLLSATGSGTTSGRSPILFKDWLKGLTPAQLRVGKDRRVRFGPDLRQVFRNIGLALEKLHKNNLYHGNLDGGIYVKSDLSIELRNMDAGRKEDGIKTDVAAFYKMVNSAISVKNVLSLPSKTVDCFRGLYNRHSELVSSKQKRKLESLLFKSELFWEPIDYVEFIYKAWDFYLMNEEIVGTAMMTSPIIGKMKGWAAQINDGSVASRILNHKPEDADESWVPPVATHDFLRFCRNFFKHHNQKCAPEKMVSLLEIDSVLRGIFPEFAALLFEFFAVEFISPHKARMNDIVTHYKTIPPVTFRW